MGGKGEEVRQISPATFAGSVMLIKCCNMMTRVVRQTCGLYGIVNHYTFVHHYQLAFPCGCDL